MNPDPDPDLTIVLLGKAGVGKSASGNTILGRTEFESDFSFEPVTKEICEKRGNVFGKLISVVDTPGILNTRRTEEQIKTFCEDLLQSSSPCLFLVVLSVGRFTEEDQKSVRAAMRVLGPQGMKKSYLLFTGGDYLKNTSLDDFLHKHKNRGEKQYENLGDDYTIKNVTLPDVVVRFAGAYHLFNNEVDDEEQVRQLLLKSGHLRPQEHPDPPDPDLTIVLLGKTGVGKSASGNTILGRPEFESKLCLKSVTKQICEERGNVFGKLISVVDTPGILDTRRTEENIKMFCEDLLQSSRRCLFLVVIRVGRFTKEDQKSVRAAMRVLGPQGMRKSYLLFTGGDYLKNMSLDDFIFEDEKGPLPDVATMFAGAYHLFNNEVDDEEQVRELLLKSGHLRPHEHPDPPADVFKDRRIVLLGLPGVGKSSSGNTILGSKKFRPGCDFNPVSTETVSESATVEGRRVTVVDTPGITDAVLTPKQLYREIMKSVVEASPGPHAFVVVVRIGRITAADVKLFELLPQLFQSGVCDAHQYSMVLFTHGDELEKDQSIDDLIRSNRHVSDLVSMCGGRYCVFDNKAKRSREQVRHFLDNIDEMVTANGGKHFTSDLFSMAERLINEERNQSGGRDADGRSLWDRIKRFGGLVIDSVADLFGNHNRFT